MTTATALNVKIPYVALQRLCIQDVAGLKLTSPEYKTISLNPSSKGNKDTNVKEGRSIGVSTRRTNDSNVKEGRWLKEQAETTHGENTALEDGATKGGESCFPAGDEGSKEHHCFRCRMNFPNSDTLVLHLKSHGPVRRSCTLYEKEVCRTSIEDSGPQNRRMLASTSKQGESTHSEEKSFPCNLCNKVFMQSNHLKLHLRSHSDGKSNKEQGTDSDVNSPPLDTTAFIKMMKNVIEETAIKCFTGALETNNIPSSSDDAVDLVRTRARKALEQYCSNSEGLMDLKQGEDDLERILQNLDDDSLDIKQEDDDFNDGNAGRSDKGVVSINSHNGSFICQNSLPNHQANFKSNLENENSTEVPECSSASDKHTENIGAPSVTDSVISSVQNVMKSKKITAVTRKAQETKELSENVQNIVENKLCTPHKISVPDTEQDVTTKVSPSKKHSPVGSTPPKEPGQSDTDAVKISGGENTALTTYQQLMLRKSKKLFSCHICHKVFTLQSHLKLHQRNVHGMKQSKPNIDTHFSENADPKEGKKDEDVAKIKQPVCQCNIKTCSKLFSKEQDFKLHLNTHQHKLHFNCSMCDKVFPEEYLLKRHEKLHSGLMYNCTMCDKAYEMNEDLLLHMSREHPANKHSPENSNKMIEETISPHSYQCLKCNIQFSDNDTYEMHLKSDHTQVPNSSIHTTPVSISGSHIGLSLHVCVKCNLQFPNSVGLEHHLHMCNSSLQEKKSALDCSNCSMKFPDDISLENHMKLTHSKMLLKCPRCDLKFPNGSALQSHMKHHVTRSPIGTPSKCSKCHSTFSTDALLERHMKLCHSMFQSCNQHTCSKCGMKFSNQALLARHTTLAHSPKFEESKVLTCSTCGMKYSDGSSFHSHMKHHTSVVQKSTELCDATVSEDVVIKLSDPDSRAKLQNISTPVDNTGTAVQCSQCDLRFSDRNEIQSHMKLNHASKIGYQYSEMNHNQHVSAKNLHPSPKGQTKQDIESDQTPVSEKSQLTQADFECSKCNFQFSDVDSLETHMKLNHTPSLQNPDMKVTKTLVSESKHTSVQNSVFSKYNGLSSKPTSTETYFRAKRTEIVFECPKCFLILKSNENLQNHIKVQHSTTPEKTNVLKCLRCHKQFHTSTRYRSHLRTHRRRLCPQCGKSFTTQTSLLKHISLHVSQLPYKCDTCHSQFSSSDLFKKHLEWHDADENLPIEDRGNIQEHTKTGNVSQSVAAAAAESFQDAPGSLPSIDSMIADSETTSHDHIEDLVTIDDDDDVIILSDDEDSVNKESHNSDDDSANKESHNSHQVEVDEIMMVLDNSSPHLFEELSDEQLRNGSPEKPLGVQTEDLHSFEGHVGVDPSNNTLDAKIANKSTVISRKLSSSVGVCKSSSPLGSFNESASDSQDTVQLENYEIVRKSPKTSPISLNRKRILKDANQLGEAQQKKRKMLRVSFADSVSDGGSDSSISSENVQRTMPKLLPECMTIDSNKTVASQNNVKHPSLFKNCSVSLTMLEDSTLEGNANEISTAGNKAALGELFQRREFSKRRIYGGKKINDEDESQEFLSLSAEAKSRNTSKESDRPGARTLLHYFHYKNAVNITCEKQNSQMMNKSSPVATSTPLINKINHSTVNSPEAEKLPEKDGHPAGDLRPHNLGLSNNIAPRHSAARNRTDASNQGQNSEPAYTRRKKHSRIKAGRFKCKTCGKVFHSLPHFRIHKKTHAGQLIHKCPICNDRFPLRFLLGLHVADHFQKGIPRMISENVMPSLNKCDTSTSKNVAPLFHIPKKKTASITRLSNASTAAETFHNGEFSYCSNASASTIERPANKSNYLPHNQSLPSETNKDYSSGFQVFDDSNESIGNCSPDTQFQCEDTLGYSQILEKNQDVEFACGKCNMKFTTFLKLKLHHSVHTGIGLYKCLYCDLMFHYKTSLLSHIETHSGEKKFACKYCGRRFEERSVMVKHRSHHEDGKRPFKCPDCPRTFALDSTLRGHMQIHMRGALYSCPFCNCSFTVKAHFQNHIIVHTGKKPFFCKVCNFAFNRLGACHKHVNLMHIAKNEITLKDGQTLKDFVQIDEEIYKELQDFFTDILSKTRFGGEGKLEEKSAEDSAIPIDKELPEPILVDTKRLQDTLGKEIHKAKANCTLSDIYTADMNKKERHEKLCIEIKNVLTRMKRFSQIPVMSPSRNQSPLKIPTKQIRDPRLRKSLNLSENKSTNDVTDTSTNKRNSSGNLNKSADHTPSPKRSSKKSASLDKKHKKTVQVYKDVIASSKGKPCKYCGEIFSKRFMKSHELTHTGSADHLCSFCDKVFTTKTGLKYHLAVHADVRPYPCAICGRAFKLKHQMLAHVRKHTNEKNHKCKVCSKAFFSKGSLNSHILTHIRKEDRPFKCDQCDQRFPTKHRLSYHAQRHSKVKPYECDICYRKFSDKSSAQRHARKLHIGRNHLSEGIGQSDEPIA